MSSLLFFLAWSYSVSAHDVDAGQAIVENDVQAKTINFGKSSEAEDYLMEAINLLQKNHINSDKIDWGAVIVTAKAKIADAKTTADTHATIWAILGFLEEKHSFFLPPEQKRKTIQNNSKSLNNNTEIEVPYPVSTLVNTRFGLIELPSLNTMGADGKERGDIYSKTLRRGLEDMDSGPLCGWIIDLRKNGGGNMWPMLLGLDPLLGKGPFGSFVVKGKETSFWQRTDNQIYPYQDIIPDRAPHFQLTHADAPVAVLLGDRTSSSGEMVAIAFLGRDNVKTWFAVV